MKTMLLILALLISSQLYAGVVEVKVSGMVCSMCAQGIHKKFVKLVGVEEVKVDLDSKRVMLKVKDGVILSDQQIKEIITEAGYNVGSIERK